MRIERWWFTARLRLRSVFDRKQVERELDEELRFHLEQKVDEGVGRGLAPEAARSAALRAMGGIVHCKEAVRDTWHIRWLTDFTDDLRYALRGLRRAPGLTVFVALALALGIGMSAATYSMLDSMIFRPYPVPEADGVITLGGTSHDSALDRFSYREYLDIRDKTRSWAGAIASSDMQEVGFAARPGATPRVRGGVMVSGNYFRVLGVEPSLGRSFRDDEDRVPGRDAVAVLGPEFFKNEFGGDPSIVGRTVRLNGREFTVIGVAPETFPGMMLFGRPDFYVPLAMAPALSTNPQKSFFEDRDDRELAVKARLGAGATLAQARRELAGLAAGLAREYPKTSSGRGAAAYTHFEARRLEDGNWRFGVIFVGLGLAVLLVACTNVAGLLLSRARSRTREIAVRLAIGAGRFRLMRLLLTESLVLATLGGVLGIGVGGTIIEWFQSKQHIIFMTDLPARVPMQMDTRVLLAALALAAVSALLCGLAPALQSSRADLVSGLKSADVEVPGRKHLWGRNVLVVAQVAMSLMLLTAALLMAHSFERGVKRGAGFAKDRLLMTGFDPRLVQYDAVRTAAFYKLLGDRVRALPGVRGATLTENVPLGQDGFDGVAFVPDGFQMPRDRANFSAPLNTVDEAYFDTMVIPILRGRGFRKSDTPEAPRVAVVNEQFARHYWPNANAVGQHIRLDSSTGPTVEIVGVARTIRYNDPGEKPQDFVYLPLGQHPLSHMRLLVRTAGDPLQILPPVKEVVRGLDANLPMLRSMAYDDYYENAVVNGPNIAIDLVFTMGAVGLVLTIAGLYGLMAYNVSRRTREIGIRMALGAGNADVLRLVMGKGLALVAVGTAIGLAMGLAVERVMDSMLFEAGGVDVMAYLVVVPSLLLVTMLASWVPARKAARIAPTLALRYE
jgi:predicted permease